MKVLVACEFSGIVRDAFIRKGHDAMSCDLLPSESDFGPHYQGDVFDIIDDGFDMMIGFPPCTYLTFAGTRHWNNLGRIKLRLEALDFFRKLWEAPIDKICLENPRGCASPVIAKYSQEIQPYYFGDKEQKTTWLWLKNLELLVHQEADTLFEKRTHSKKPKPHSFLKTTGKPTYFADGKTRDPHERSRFWPGIAAAMADQWGDL